MEYLKVDPRYITKHYVWIFELFNAALALLFLFALIFKNYKVVKYLCLMLVTTTILYFLTLIFEIQNDKNMRNMIETYAQSWMWVYYLVSGIYIIIPTYMFLLL
jgi:hypothetical protein